MHSARLAGAQGRNVTGRGYNIPMPEIPPGSGETVRPHRADGERPAEAAGLQPGPAPARRPAHLPLHSPRPLPDAVAVRELIVPDSAPPFDDEPFDDEAFDDEAFDDEGFGAERPEPAPAHGAGPAHAEPDSPWPPGAGPDGGPGPGGTASPGQDRWPGQFAQVLAETLAGSRPPGQIRPWTTEQARRRIRQLGPLLAAGQRPRLRRIIASCPAADVVEMTVVAAFGPRVRVLAVRLEREGAPPRSTMAGGTRWRCTTVEAA
jgi:Family of unknown function (DUF6459)